jgi:hypothetical protein
VNRVATTAGEPVGQRRRQVGVDQKAHRSAAQAACRTGWSSCAAAYWSAATMSSRSRYG